MIRPIPRDKVAQVIEGLGGQEIGLTYTKQDGSTREVNLKLNKPIKVDSLLRAYDKDRQGYRSFRLDNISEITTKDITYLTF